MNDDLTPAQRRKMEADLAGMQRMLGVPMGATPEPDLDAQPGAIPAGDK